ncbi:MAG TPA: polysaccharide export protein [Alphaproteobacteria bacterium]|nr:polysaccharide export protein [Alphaproteobacteria bacterium]
MLKPVVLVIAALGLAACSSLPRSGPSDQRIVSAATTRLTQADRGSLLQYALIDIDQSVLSAIPDYTVGSLNRSLGMGRTSAADVRIGVGDVVQLTVFESSDGGLFIPAGGAGSAGNFVTFPSQAVDASGVISVPFAGSIKAVGLSVPELEDTVEERLSGRAIEPQVIATVNRGAASEVTVLGEVGSPQKLPVSQAGDRILDVLARAGGVKAPPYEAFVSVTRNGRKAQIYFNELVANAGENIYLAPGDVVFVSSEKRFFTAFGSTGLSGEFDFGEESITLDRAVGKAGGLLDGRADPRQVFLYRIEPRETLAAMGADLSRFPGGQKAIPTVYRVNFADPAGFFLARSFPMRNGDVIYISNADAVELGKVLTVIQGTLGVTNQAINTVRNATE